MRVFQIQAVFRAARQKRARNLFVVAGKGKVIGKIEPKQCLFTSGQGVVDHATGLRCFAIVQNLAIQAARANQKRPGDARQLFSRLIDRYICAQGRAQRNECLGLRISAAHTGALPPSRHQSAASAKRMPGHRQPIRGNCPPWRSPSEAAATDLSRHKAHIAHARRQLLRLHRFAQRRKASFERCGIATRMLQMNHHQASGSPGLAPHIAALLLAAQAMRINNHANRRAAGPAHQHRNISIPAYIAPNIGLNRRQVLRESHRAAPQAEPQSQAHLTCQAPIHGSQRIFKPAETQLRGFYQGKIV